MKNKPIPANMQIVDATGAEITVPAVAKHADHIPLESLGGAGVDPKSLPFPLPHGQERRTHVTEFGVDPVRVLILLWLFVLIAPPCFLCVSGGKAFEQPEFSSGLLMLPPRAKKQLEEANNNEVFYVIEGPANMLQVTVHHTVLHLSKGQSHNRATACERECRSDWISDWMLTLLSPSLISGVAVFPSLPSFSIHDSDRQSLLDAESVSHGVHHDLLRVGEARADMDERMARTTQSTRGGGAKTRGGTTRRAGRGGRRGCGIAATATPKEGTSQEEVSAAPARPYAFIFCFLSHCLACCSRDRAASSPRVPRVCNIQILPLYSAIA